MEALAAQRAEREARVLALARELIAERGYEGVTMRDLARRSRVSVPTLYKLFGDKDALLVRAVGEQLAAFLTRVEVREAGSGCDLLLALPESAARAMVREARYSRAVISVFVGAGRIQEVTDTVLAALTDELAHALEQMRARGELESWAEPRTLAERIASHHVMACVQWASGQLDDAALAASLVYGVATMAAGMARDGAAERLTARARAVQPAARLLPATGQDRPLRQPRMRAARAAGWRLASALGRAAMRSNQAATRWFERSRGWPTPPAKSRNA